MKANQKFLKNKDDAVSPVIAVILMVAITVVLAATVYVWVSGFGAQSSNPAKTISLTSDGPISSGIKTYTVASASPGMRWSDLDFTLDGSPLALHGSGCTPASGNYSACAAGSLAADSATVSAGNTVSFYVTSGQALRILDANANSVILTLTVG